MNFYLTLILLATIWAQSNQQQYTTFGNYNYIFSRNASTYDIARNRCRKIDAELVVIYNEAIFNHIVTFIKGINPRPCSLWIGLRRNPSNLSNFVWYDKTPLGEFKKWSGENGHASKNQHEECVIMGYNCGGSTYNWFDIPCKGLPFVIDYLCQKSTITFTDGDVATTTTTAMPTTPATTAITTTTTTTALPTTPATTAIPTITTTTAITTTPTTTAIATTTTTTAIPTTVATTALRTTPSTTAITTIPTTTAIATATTTTAIPTTVTTTALQTTPSTTAITTTPTTTAITTTTATTASATTRKTPSGPSIYIIIGAAAGGAVVIIFLIVLIVVLKRRKRKNDKNKKQDSPEQEPVLEEHAYELEEPRLNPNESNCACNNQNTDHDEHAYELEGLRSNPNESKYVCNNHSKDHADEQYEASPYLQVDELKNGTTQSNVEKISASNEPSVYSVIDKKANKFVVESPETENSYNTVNASQPFYDVFVRNGTVSTGSVEGTYNTLQHPAPVDEYIYNTMQHNHNKTPNHEDTYNELNKR